MITGGFVGVTSVFGYGKTLETLNAGAGASTRRAAFSEAIKDGGRNSSVAGAQTVFENGVARNTYDPNRGYLDNVRERMMAAGITGAALKGGLEIIGKVRQGANPQVLAETQKIFRIEKSPIEINVKQIEYRNSGIDLKAKLNEKLKSAEIKPTQTRNLTQTEQVAQKEAIKLIEQAKRSEPKVTQDLQILAKQRNGEMIRLDYRFKSEESLTRKINDSATRETTILMRKVVNQKDAFSTAINKQTNKINDSLRYTISFSAEKYKAEFQSTLNSLQEKGYKIEGTWNAWFDAGTSRDSGYRGINVTIISPGGQKFELQFHTPESFKMKMETHELYEEKRLNTTSFERKNEITNIMIEKAKTVPIP